MEHSNYFPLSMCYTTYLFAALIWLQLGFMLLALIWKFDFPPFMVLIIAILNDGSWFLSSSKTPPIFVQVHIACTYNDF